jgi:7,8-dihydropterin-6-yl-methyl-4-(beta-D-ribofuranosyl)aminobenzene 5'-phosphate synthase
LPADIRRRELLVDTAVFAGMAAVGLKCVEIASAAPNEVVTVDKLAICVIVDQQHDQFLPGSTVNGVAHEWPGPVRSEDARNALHHLPPLSEHIP